MDDYELAKALFKQPKDKQAARVVSGQAYSDSADGSVQVNIDGSVITLPTNVSVKDGDVVQVTISDRSPVVTGVVGRGDEMQAEIDAVADVSNYFWHDSAGAHVSNIDHDTSGNNILIDADSVDIKDGADVLASFEATTLSLGKMSDTAEIKLCGETGKIHYDKFVDPYDESNSWGNLIMGAANRFRTDSTSLITEGAYSNKASVSATHTKYDSESSILATAPDGNGGSADAYMKVEQIQGQNTKAYISADNLYVDAAINFNNNPGISGQVITSQGANATPIWSTPASGSIKCDLIYDTPLYWWDNGSISGTDSGSDDPSRAGRPYGELDAPITDYDVLIVCFRCGASAGAANLTNARLTQVIPVSEIEFLTTSQIDNATKTYEFIYCVPAGTPTWYTDVAYGFTNSTTLYAKRRSFYQNLPYWNIDKIYGIKF